MKFFFLLYIFLLFFYTLDTVSGVEENQLFIFFGLFLSAIVVPSMFLFRAVGLFEPMLWFSVYYYVLIYSEFAVLRSNFHLSTFFENTYFYSNNLDIFLITVWVILGGYLCFVFSYNLLLNKKIEKKGNYLVKGVSPKLIKISAYLFMAIAIFNFILNIKVISNFDLLSYFEFIKYNAGHFVDFGVTIVGYNFIYISVFFVIYLYFNRKVSEFTLVAFLFVFLLLVASLGRITGFGMSVIIIYLVFSYANNVFFLNKKRVIVFSFLSFGVISLFFLRMYSEYHRVFDTSFNDFISNELSNALYILIGEGNLPNVGIVMKIIDSWEADIGYLYGSSIFIGFAAFLPSDISVDLIQNNTVSWISKNVWFSGIHGGGLPPTVIGELYANFSFIGILLGMSLLGGGLALTYNSVMKKKNYFIFVLYAYFLTRFVFLLPKGEFARISVMLIPLLILVCVVIIHIFTSGVKKQ